ncbi:MULTISPECIES: urease subunit beta [Brevibacterium]|uniref:Urease subunit beta n=2 Tax=Brevibacterium TaxID=1696 RepID=A0ABP9U4R3_9MICO
MAGTRDHGPGAVRVREGTRVLNRRDSAGETGTVTIENTGDRPVQIGSHIHLPDVNAALAFDRRQTDGFRLDVPAGTSVRFEPGVSRTVPIVSLGGRRVVPGLQIRGDAGGNADDLTEVAAPTVAADRTSVAGPTSVADPTANDPIAEAGDC